MTPSADWTELKQLYDAALALPALAQTPPPTPATPAAATKAAEAPARKPGGPDMQKRHEEHMAYMAKRQAALKEKLKLTAGQESAWTTFTTAMQPGERPARPDPKELDKLTTPERIDRMRELRAQHTAAQTGPPHCAAHLVSDSAQT
eukprot:gene46571-58066_t